MARKFRVGDRVICRHPHWPPFEGVISRISDTGDDMEYWVTNAPEVVPGFPLLFWEHEMELTK